MNRFGDWVGKLAGFFEGQFNNIGEFLSDIPECTGNLLFDGVHSLFNKAVFLRAFFDWIFGIISQTFELAGIIIKSVLGIVGGAFAFTFLIAGGLFRLNLNLVKKGLGTISSTILGAVILILGKVTALLQTILLLERPKQKLSAHQRKILQKAFGHSFSSYCVRIKEGRSGLFGLSPRAFTLGNVIYLKASDVEKNPDLLVHESAHAWQFQNVGARYSSDALWGQFFVEDAYNWKKELDRGKKSWTEFNKEAQAEFLQDIYLRGELLKNGAFAGRGNGIFYEADNETSFGRLRMYGEDLSDVANKTVGHIRSEKSARLSLLLKR